MRPATPLIFKRVRRPGTISLSQVSFMHYLFTAYVVQSIETRGFLVPSHNTHASYTPSQPPQPPPVPRSTRPYSNVTAPAPTFAPHPAPPHEYPRHPPAPQMSGSISHYSSTPDSGPSIPARPRYTTTHTNDSGRPPQHLMIMPVPIRSNATASVPYPSGSSYPPPQSEMSGRQPKDWCYRGCSTLL